MRRKLTEETITYLAVAGHIFLAVVPLVGLGLCVNFFHWNFSIIFFSSLLGSIWVVFFLDKDTMIQDYLNIRNEKIDEAEQARQQALLLEAEERIRTQSQIWVI